MAKAVLLGADWEQWRGAWSSSRVLRFSEQGWKLSDGNRGLDSWSSFSEAVIDLWPKRNAREHEPWAIGWLGYEAAAALAGGLPSHQPEMNSCSALLLLEPERVKAPMLADGHPQGGELSCSLSDEEFRRGVTQTLDLIEWGGLYQMNLTRRFVGAWSGGLRPILEIAGKTPPPYLSWFSDGDLELVCASMELLVRRRRERAVTAPIKGTRPRGGDFDQDRALVEELDQDPKERAELAMVVDLERNDLGQVAVPGSVVVTKPGLVQSYANVHHRVATVEAEVQASLPWWELLAAMAPGGSVTGCPKWAAMDVIRRLEPTPRGPFTGALGVVAGNGDLEMALPIRTAWKQGQALTMAAGCGIVWGSDPEREQLESRLKIDPWLGLFEEVRRK